jgi:hypothetical protein
MSYVATTKATDFASPDWKERLVRAVLFFIRRASPDHEALYPYVRKWLIEIDEFGQTHREIGLDHNGTPLLAAPDEKNIGFWTDAPYRFTPHESEPIDAGYFESLWQRTSRDAK